MLNKPDFAFARAVVDSSVAASTSPIVHGHAKRGKNSRTYVSWLCMNTRCHIPNRPRRYLEKGITICPRWRRFENFLEDMGERPIGMTLGRIDNSGNYEPSNCRWETIKDQNRNRSPSRLNICDAVVIIQRWKRGESMVSIARAYGISESLPREIIKGRLWRDATVIAKEWLHHETQEAAMVGEMFK